MKKLAYLLCGVCCLLWASCATSPENIRERMDFGEGWRLAFPVGRRAASHECRFCG